MSVTLTPAVRAMLMQEPCVYCGRPAEGLDHIRAATDHGHDGYDNRAPSCIRCDQLKANVPLLIFLWASDFARRRVEERRRFRTIQQRVAAWRATVNNKLRPFRQRAT